MKKIMISIIAIILSITLPLSTMPYLLNLSIIFYVIVISIDEKNKYILYLEQLMYIFIVIAAIQIVVISFQEFSKKPEMICKKDNNEVFISKYKILKNEDRLLDLKTDNLFILKDCIEIKE
jgi:hypothetical protein